MSKQKKFPNGFRSWVETHHEVVAFITHHLIGGQDAIRNNDEPDTIIDTHESVGTKGLYELAEQWTNDFEKEHKGWDWDDNDYWLTIEAWLDNKNKI